MGKRCLCLAENREWQLLAFFLCHVKEKFLMSCIDACYKFDRRDIYFVKGVFVARPIFYIRLFTVERRMTMKIKLFATDLDGTLLTSDDKISPKNIQAMRDAVNAGVMVTLATGRMYSSAVQYARQIDIDVPLITYNGALIKATSGRVYNEKYIKQSVVKEIVAYCAQKQWYLQVNSNDALYFPVYLERSAAYEKSTEIKGETVGWQGLGQKNENVAKMLLVTEDYGKKDGTEKIQEENEMLYELTQKFAGKVMLVKSKKGLIEIVNPEVSKANALHILAGRFGFSIEDVMAIGDADNDLPMLEAAGKSVAMGNAAANIKAACDYVVGTNDDDGVAEAIYKYVLNK